MSIVVTVNLPLETVNAIQNCEEFEHVLQDFGFNTATPYRLVHDIACNVISAVSAVPYSIIPKAAPASLSFTAPVTTPPSPAYNLKGRNQSCASPISWLSSPPPSPPMTIFSHSNPADTPMKPSAKPASRSHRSMSPELAPNGFVSNPNVSQIDGWGQLSDDYDINFVIRDLMNKEEVFCAPAYETFAKLANIYKERRGILVSSLIFRLEHGAEIQTAWFDRTLPQVGIHEGCMILATPKHIEPIRDICLSVHSSVLGNSSIGIESTASVHSLIESYRQSMGLYDMDLTFTFRGWNISLDDSCSLVQLGITSGSIVQVEAANEISITFRDAMLNETKIKVLSSYNFDVAAAKYLEVAEPSIPVYYSTSKGNEMTALSDALSDDYYEPLKKLGIVDGTVVNVHPVRSVPRAARVVPIVKDNGCGRPSLKYRGSPVSSAFGINGPAVMGSHGGYCGGGWDAASTVGSPDW